MFKQLRRIQARIFLGRESDKIAGSHDPANFGRLVISAGNHNHESFFGRCFFQHRQDPSKAASADMHGHASLDKSQGSSLT